MDKVKILLVDDYEDTTISLSLCLKKDIENVTVFTANSAEEAMNILNTQDINILITDNEMPITTGTDFIKNIHKMGFKIPTIILTGNPGILPKEELQKIGVIGILIKCIDLRSTLKELIVNNI